MLLVKDEPKVYFFPFEFDLTKAQKSIYYIDNL